MKIGILTFHRPINYGAFLQAYSLSNELHQRVLSCEVSIIDYIAPAEKSKIYINILRTLKHNGVINAFRDIKKVCVFGNAQGNLHTTKIPRIGSNLISFYTWIDLNFDLLVIGSDAVFNWNQNGYPTAFIPEYNFGKCRVVSYAASVHGLRFMEEDRSRLEQCGRTFSKMEFLGVRDLCTEQFVRECLPSSEPIHCCDPTLVIDVEKVHKLAGNYIKRVYKKYQCDLQKKYIVLMLPDGKISESMRKKYAKDYNIITLFKPSKDADYYLYDLNPFEWATVLADASLVVTSYFHGSLLSLVQNTPVISVDYSNYSDAPYEGKLKDLFERRLSLPELYFEASVEKNDELILQLLNIADAGLRGDFADRITRGVQKESKSMNAFFEYLQNVKC